MSPQEKKTVLHYMQYVEIPQETLLDLRDEAVAIMEGKIASRVAPEIVIVLVGEILKARAEQ